MFSQLCAALVVATASVMTCATLVSAQDTIRIHSTSAPVWGPAVKLVPLLSIGSLANSDEHSSGNIDNLAVDRKGRMYVYDGQDQQIRLFDAKGKFVQNIGQKGGGPGEYRSVSGMSIADDTVLAIHDPSAARVSYFYPNGKLRGNFVEPRSTWGSENSFVVDKQGLTYLRVPMRQVRGEERVSESEIVQSMRVLRMRMNGTIVDTIPLPPPLKMEVSKSFYLSSPDGGNSNFQAESFFSSLPSGGIVFGNGDAMRLLIRRPGGAPVVVDRPFKPVAVGKEEHANWEEYAVYMANRDKGGPPRDYKIPRVKPVFRDLLVDRDSRIWVSVYTDTKKVEPRPLAVPRPGPRLHWIQAATYGVFSDAGVYLGRVELPIRTRLLTAQGNRIWTLGKGEDDEDIINVFTLSGSGALK